MNDRLEVFLIHHLLYLLDPLWLLT